MRMELRTFGMDQLPVTSPGVQYVVSGIALGSLYAMVAIGFNIIYNATGIINLAQGEFVMLGGLIVVWTRQSLDLPMGFGLLLTVAIVAGIGIAFERLAIRPLKNPSVLTLIIITIGGSFIFKGTAMIIWGKDVYSLPQFSGEHSIWLLGAAIKPQDLWVWGTLAAIVTLLNVFFKYTVMGKAMRACSYNRTAARLVGINVETMVMLAFGISAGIGALGGAVVVPITSADYECGALFGLKGFSAAVLGGLGNNSAAVIAGIILGILESVAAGMISSHYKDAITLAVLLIVLFVRPSGLFGRTELSRLSEF